jgi:hypothetical protein
MERRKFMIGIGSLAAGSAAATGTGAFSAMSASRSANIDVVNDSNGLIGLEVGGSADGRVNTNDGELAINFTSEQGGQGVNVNSRYQVGEFCAVDKAFTPDLDPDGPVLKGTSSNAMDDPAFEITNNDSVNHEITIKYECTAEDIGGARLIWQFEDEARQYFIDLSGSNTSGSTTIDGKGADPAPEPGDAVGAALLVDTRDYTGDADDLDLSGSLTVSAE